MRLTSRAQIAYSRLYQQYNDIDVFVEDSTYAGVYESIINRILAGRAKVTRVTPLGPKSEVEKFAREDRSVHIRPRLYIVDGDLDLISQGRKEKIENLYRLNVYSVENLVLDLDALKKYCRFSCPGVDEASCHARCDVDSLFREMEDNLVPYIVALAIARRLQLSNRVSAINPPSVSNVVGGKRVGPSKDLVRRRLREIIKEACDVHGLKKYRDAKRLVVSKVLRNKHTAISISPGKLFALSYLNERVANAGGMTLPQKAIVSYLAEHASLKIDNGLRAALARAARNIRR